MHLFRPQLWDQVVLAFPAVDPLWFQFILVYSLWLAFLVQSARLLAMLATGRWRE